jgi:hypothetical protein
MTKTLLVPAPTYVVLTKSSYSPQTGASALSSPNGKNLTQDFYSTWHINSGKLDLERSDSWERIFFNLTATR